MANSTDQSHSTRGGEARFVDHSEAQFDQQFAVDVSRWQVCALSGEDLAQGQIMACKQGNLFNKPAVLEFLLGTAQFQYSETRDLLARKFSHIKKLKDLFPVVLTENPDYSQVFQASHIKSGGSTSQKGPWLCPITHLETNGKHRFCALRRCGHVFSARALAELRGVRSGGEQASGVRGGERGAPHDRGGGSSRAQQCPQCSKAFSKASDTVELNPSPASLSDRRKRPRPERSAHEAAEGGSPGARMRQEPAEQEQQQQQQRRRQRKLLLLQQSQPHHEHEQRKTGSRKGAEDHAAEVDDGDDGDADDGDGDDEEADPLQFYKRQCERQALHTARSEPDAPPRSRLRAALACLKLGR
jgi:hypothetical protein